MLSLPGVVTEVGISKGLSADVLELALHAGMVVKLVLIILLITKGRVQRSIESLVEKERATRIHRLTNVIFWALEVITLVLIGMAGVAIVLSQEGIYNVITVPMVQQWFLEHGARILIILLAGFVLWYVLKRFLPGIVQRSMAQPRRGESRVPQLNR